MAAQWPRVQAALASLLPGLPGWPSQVYDGPPVTGEAPLAYATVGYAFPEDSGGSYETETAGNGFQVVERGFIRCEVVAATGDADLPAVRARAFALMDSLDQSIRDDRTLGGVLSPDSTCTLSVDVVPVQSDRGAVQRIPFSLNYQTRT